jgi:hypothetical protein
MSTAHAASVLDTEHNEAQASPSRRLTLSISGGAHTVRCMLLLGVMPRILLFWRGHAGGKGREGGVASVSRFPSGSRT